MRVVALAALAALSLSSVSLAAEKNPNAAITFNWNEQDSPAFGEFVQRFQVAGEYNAKLGQVTPALIRRADVSDDDPFVYVLLLDSKSNIKEIAYVLKHEVEDVKEQAEDRHFDILVIDEHAPVYELVKTTIAEAKQNADSPMELSTYSIDRLQAAIVVEARWPKQ